MKLVKASDLVLGMANISFYCVQCVGKVRLARYGRTVKVFVFSIKKFELYLLSCLMPQPV